MTASSTNDAPNTVTDQSEKRMKVSPSQIATSRKCLRKWGFKMLEGMEEPKSAAQEKGILGHARIEQYQKNSAHPGDDEMGKLIQQAMRPDFLPVPHPGSLVEQHLVIDIGNGDIFHGYSDLITHPSVDDDGMPIVVDYKFTSNARYAMTPDELKKDAQGVGYSKAALNTFPEAPGVKNRWIYFDHKARKIHPVRITRSPAQLSDQWEELAAEARGLLVLRRKKARAVDLRGNPEACGDYGGCPFASHCDVPKRSSSLFGNRKQFTLSADNSSKANSSGSVADPENGKNIVGISLREQLAQLKAQGVSSGGFAAPAASAPTTAPGAVPATTPLVQPAAPGATSGLGALAALQAAKGFTGVNPAPSAPAPQAPAPVAAPAAAPAPAAPAPGKRTLKEMMGFKKPAEATAGQTPAPVAETTVPAEAPAARGVETQSHAPSASQEVAYPTQAEVDASVQVQVAEPKKTRVKKGGPDVPASSLPQTAMSELSVLYNAVIMKHPNTTQRPVMLIDLLAPLMREVADGAQKAHWALIPYNEAKALLAHAFDKWLEDSKWKGTILVNGNSLEVQAVDAVLKHRADVVVGGLS